MLRRRVVAIEARLGRGSKERFMRLSRRVLVVGSIIETREGKRSGRRDLTTRLEVRWNRWSELRSRRFVCDCPSSISSSRVEGSCVVDHVGDSTLTLRWSDSRGCHNPRSSSDSCESGVDRRFLPSRRRRGRFRDGRSYPSIAIVGILFICWAELPTLALIRFVSSSSVSFVS